MIAKLGSAAQWESGKGHDRDVNWCYRGAEDVTLYFQSDASDMGTKNHELTMIRLLLGARDGFDGHACGRTTVRLPDGIGSVKLGMSAAEVVRMLGTPTQRMRDSLYYTITSTELLDPKSPYYARWNTPEQRKSCFEGKAPYVNIGGAMLFVFRADRATELQVTRYDNAMC